MWCIYKVEHQAVMRMNDLVTWVYSIYKTWSIHLGYVPFWYACFNFNKELQKKKNGKRSCSRNSCPRNVLGHHTEALPHPCPKAHPGQLGSQAGRFSNFLQQPALTVLSLAWEEGPALSGVKSAIEKRVQRYEYTMCKSAGCQPLNIHRWTINGTLPGFHLTFTTLL